MTIDRLARRKLAIKALVDERTIERALKGLPVRGMAGDRARAALKAAGIDTPTPLDETDGLTDEPGLTRQVRTGAR